MRHKIYEIYKALRHFGVSAEEIDGIARNYKFWINHPLEELKCGYRMVYHYKGTLCVMPFVIDELKSRFVGVELNGVIYLTCFRKYVYGPGVEECQEQLKSNFREKKFYYPEEAGLPTAEEITALIDTIGDDVLPLGYTVYHYFDTYWIKPDAQTPDKTVAEVIHLIDNRVGYNAYRPKKSTYAVVCLVTHLRKGIDFVGCLNHFGMPDAETAERYRDLLDSVKH